MLDNEQDLSVQLGKNMRLLVCHRKDLWVDHYKTSAVGMHTHAVEHADT